jgi:predicted dehydrogenase
MGKPLRVGIVGLGAVANMHLKAYEKVAGMEVIGAADASPSRVASARTEFSFPIFTTLKELISELRPDICCVLTPPAAHEEATVRCAEAGVHVLCEKPMALSIRACQIMIEACRQNGVKLCYGASYRYLPTLLMAREMILDGQLGEILLLREYMVGGSGVSGRQTLGPSHYPLGGPGGSAMGLCDHGIHLIDAFGWMINAGIEGVWGRGNRTGEPQEPEYAHLKFTNGAIGQLLYEDGTYGTELPSEGLFSWGGGWSLGNEDVVEARAASRANWQSQPACIHVHGTKGALRIFYYANALFHFRGRKVQQIEVPKHIVPDNFAAQMTAFTDAVRSNQAAPVSGEVGLSACRALLGIYAGMGVPVQTD